MWEIIHKIIRKFWLEGGHLVQPPVQNSISYEVRVLILHSWVKDKDSKPDRKKSISWCLLFHYRTLRSKNISL